MKNQLRRDLIRVSAGMWYSFHSLAYVHPSGYKVHPEREFKWGKVKINDQTTEALTDL